MSRPNFQKIQPAIDVEAARDKVRAVFERVYVIAGGVIPFGRRLNDELRKRGLKEVSRQLPVYWRSEGAFIDERYWQPIESITDMEVTRRHLRPDKYPNG